MTVPRPTQGSLPHAGQGTFLRLERTGDLAVRVRIEQRASSRQVDTRGTAAERPVYR
jgi:hypothetical protein